MAPPDALSIRRTYFSAVMDHLQAEFPMEACGLLAGVEKDVVKVYPIDNILRSPIAFEMDPRQQIDAILDMEARNWEFLAIYHSHPEGPQVPSATDVAQAYYPEAANLIVSFKDRANPIARAYTIVDGQVEEIPVLIE